MSTGRLYFYNTRTGESRWELPADPAPDRPRPPPPPLPPPTSPPDASGASVRVGATAGGGEEARRVQEAAARLAEERAEFERAKAEFARARQEAADAAEAEAVPTTPKRSSSELDPARHGAERVHEQAEEFSAERFFASASAGASPNGPFGGGGAMSPLRRQHASFFDFGQVDEQAIASGAGGVPVPEPAAGAVMGGRPSAPPLAAVEQASRERALVAQVATADQAAARAAAHGARPFVARPPAPSLVDGRDLPYVARPPAPSLVVDDGVLETEPAQGAAPGEQWACPVSAGCGRGPAVPLPPAAASGAALLALFASL